MRLLKSATLIVFLAVVFSCNLYGQDNQPYRLLKGTVSAKDHQSYIEVPFALPERVKRLTVEFWYNKIEERTTLNLGVSDPQEFRGWSGGAKNRFTISKEDATPGYLPGKIPSGVWKLLVGVPNIRKGVVAEYEAKVFIDTIAGITEFNDRPIRSEAGWYRGDLHMHSGNSDGKCTSQSGKDVSCPVYRVVETAAKKGLDFIALTDHNTTAQSEELRELQPAFDKLLFLPGQEITTFYGHSNVFGLTDFIDFRTTAPSYSQAKKWMDAANRAGAIVSINHPGVVSGENCMGCGWQIDSIPNGVIASIELVNGGGVHDSGSESSVQGWNLWHKMLNAGQHITAIGGSDDHHAGEQADTQGTIGTPTTVVYMKELSVKGALDGIRSGRVFIDIERNKNHFIELSASNKKNNVAVMGDILKISPFDTVDLTAEVRGVPNSKIEFIVDGELKSELIRPITSDAAKVSVLLKTDNYPHTVYAKVRGANGKLVLVGNPIYIRVLNK